MDIKELTSGLKEALCETMTDNSTPDVVYEFKVKVTVDSNDMLNKSLKSEIKATLKHALEEYDAFIEVEDV